MPDPLRSRRATNHSFWKAAAIVCFGSIVLALHIEAILHEPDRAAGLIGSSLWRVVVDSLGAKTAIRGGVVVAEIAFTPILLLTIGLSSFAWLAGAAVISRRRGIPFRAASCLWGQWGWLWWMVPVLWEFLATIAELTGSTSLEGLLARSLPLQESTLWAGWLTTLVALIRQPAARFCDSGQPIRVPTMVWGAMAVYFLCFGAMNWLLYESLLVPHGDSAMYEEHVWNLLHGKGFRSYLDNGRLFLGEHVQVIHLFVIPLYIFWPSHILLELCQSAALALGAIAVFRIAFRHSGSTTAASLLAIAYLLYLPMQFLDIAITFKTFRPNSFEVPLLLFAFDALERCRYRTFPAWLGLSLLCQEDAAMVIAPLGAWIALRQARFAGVADRAGRRRLAWFGSGMALFGVTYVVLVITVILPLFRGGEDVHFARYFGDLGTTSGEIVTNVATHPGRFLAMFLNVDSVMFGLQLLVPLGFLPLFSPGRLAVGAPLFAVLCLSKITNSPFHHFHAPLVAILLWSAAAGMVNFAGACGAGAAWWRRRKRKPIAADAQRCRIPPEKFAANGKSLTAVAAPMSAVAAQRPGTVSGSDCVVVVAAVWAVLNAGLTGFSAGLTPLGNGFWDPASRAYWRNLYVPGERARQFPAAFALVPRDSRVASTDYIHPRFTHHWRSYDYSHYRPEVPEDTEYIVIDTRHPYSGIRVPQEVKEFRDEPEKWELLEDHTQGYFIVLKRRPRDPANDAQAR